jgi:chemotaxis protein methyltransferase CheR
MEAIAISEQEFGQFRDLLRQLAGINLTPAKKALVCSRLEKRLRHHRLHNYADYYSLIQSGQDPRELQTAVDLLTTNETYFFREPKHFEHLADNVLAGWPRGQAFRARSAASSSGEEAYSIAMLLADKLGESPWEVVGTDISSRVLDRAVAAHYSLERTEGVPQRYLQQYCLKGIGAQHGTFLVGRELRSRVRFVQANLCAQLPALGSFDAIFLRNVMIYFEAETKRQVVARMLPLLKPGGLFIVGHSESLNGISEQLKSVAPSIYRKP